MCPHDDFEACVEVVTGVNLDAERGISAFVMDEVKTVDPHVAREIDGFEVNEEMRTVACIG